MTRMTRMASLVVLAACGGARPPSEPVAMTIKAVAADASASAAVPAPAEPDDESALQVFFWGSRLCARAGGEVFCQPWNEHVEPVVQAAHRIEGIEDAIDVATDPGSLCAVIRGGRVMCLGENTFGELGAKTARERSDTPLLVVGVERARHVTLNGQHACAVLEDKTVKCWGRNDRGQTGSDTHYLADARDLVTATLVPNVKAESVVTANFNTCARTPERQVMCWGGRQDPDHPFMAMTSERPKKLRLAEETLDDVTILRGNDSGYCVVRRGRLQCWGAPLRLLARGGSDEQANRGAAIKDVQDVALSSAQGCVLHTDGRVSCFGYPYSRALGSRVDGYEAVPAEVVAEAPRGKAVIVGMSASCVLTRTDDLYCWGRWQGSQGAIDHPAPVAVRLR